MPQPKKELALDIGEWRDQSGGYFQLCVVEELDEDNTESMPAIITFGGFSLCRDHFFTVTELIKSGIPMGEVVRLMMTEGLD